ncbi:MAG: hypothetical protein OXR66_04065 [Candidatus Woesearchaeota archaeon]|nr:hypothetical protein [Candidatus Woesearchaeota archaeon]
MRQKLIIGALSGLSLLLTCTNYAALQHKRTTQEAAAQRTADELSSLRDLAERYRGSIAHAERLQKDAADLAVKLEEIQPKLESRPAAQYF